MAIHKDFQMINDRLVKQFGEQKGENMFSVIVGIVVFTLFIGIMGIAFTLKRKKNNASCSGGCSACRH